MNILERFRLERPTLSVQVSRERDYDCKPGEDDDPIADESIGERYYEVTVEVYEVIDGVLYFGMTSWHCFIFQDNEPITTLLDESVFAEMVQEALGLMEPYHTHSRVSHGTDAGDNYALPPRQSAAA